MIFSKIFEALKKDYKFIVWYLILMTIVLLIATTSSIGGDYTLHLPGKDVFANITYIVTIIAGLVYFLVFNKFESKNIKLEYLYLALVIPLGLMYCFANPIGMVPDEDQHARRSLAISEGIFFAEKDDKGQPVAMLNSKINELVTRNVKSYEDAINRITLAETDEKISMNYSMATYAPICHMPQALGMFCARLLGGGISIQCYVARIVNMLFAIYLMYLSIKLIPTKKHIVLFLGLLPLTINEFASMSSDALTISSCILYIAYICYLKYDESKNSINKKDIVLLTILSICVSLLKIVYVPICLLLLILPKEKFKTKKQKNLVVWMIIAFCMILNIVWLIYASGFLNEVNPGVNPAGQVKYILTNPFEYCLILFRTIHMYFQTFILSLCGEGLGHYNVQSSVLFTIPCLILFTILFFVNEEKDKKVFELPIKILSLIIFICVVLLIYTSLYVAWTVYESPVILGVQARYFLPVLLLMAVVLENNKIILNCKLKDKYLASFMLFMNFNTLSCITYTYIFEYIITYYIK